VQGDVLVEIRTDIGIIKHDQSRLSESIESLAHSVQGLSESFKNDHNDLRKDYMALERRLAKIEVQNENKKSFVNTWLSPIINPAITAILLGGLYTIANHLH
jgi:flagellar capping protein FliD